MLTELGRSLRALGMEDIERKLGSWALDLEREIERTRPRSRELFEKARKVLPGGVTYHIRFYRPYPLYIAKGRGSKVTDVDGFEYVDMWMGHGALILGHNPEPLIKAMEEAKEVGTHLGYANQYAVEYAELLTKVLPNADMVRFCNSGTEANMYALRLARAYTGRKYVIKMEGGWHGGYDALHVGVSYPYRGPESAGLPEEYISLTLVVPYNDIDALEKALREHEVAAVVLEPVLGAGGCIGPREGYLKEVIEVAHSYGALVVFDEVITGFRLALGGAQEYFNVKPDIVVLGKIVGGGVAGAGAFAARSEIMELLDNIKHPDARKRPFHGGTFTGNPLTILAGMNMVRYLASHRELYDKLDEITRVLMNGVEKACRDHDVECFTTGARGMVGIHFTRSRPLNVRQAHEERWSNAIYRALHKFAILDGYLYMTESNAHLLPSMVHSEEEAKGFVDMFYRFVEEVKKLI